MTDDFLDPVQMRFYQDVPGEQVARLARFRRDFPYKKISLSGFNWCFIDTEQGDPTIFILAGATTIAEISFNTLEHLAAQYRVIAPDYPPISKIGPLFDGYLALLDQLGIDRFVLMGGSYGGWMAQSMVRLFPKQIDKVVLSAIGPPNPQNSRQLARMFWMLRLMPFSLLKAFLNRTFSRLVSQGDLQPVQSLMMAQLSEILHTRLTRRDILAALQRLIDQTDHYTFGPDDLAGWAGQMLVLMGSEDPSTPLETRQAMAALYPYAQHIVFEGADHSVSVTHREQYYSALDDFLAS